jgi:hypothetical protein
VNFSVLAIPEFPEAVFPAIPYYNELIGAPCLENDPDAIDLFRLLS